MSTHKSENSAYEGKYLPPEDPNRSRTLVLCFDGTGNKIGNNHTNVSQFFSMLRKDDCNRQMVYYQTGIGTYTKHRFGPIASVVAKTLDSMLGGGIHAHIQDGYEFLMQNYRADDRICIFGFSRGAYTARALAAMIHKVGLLPPSNIKHIEYAYKAFLKPGDEGWEVADEFRRSFCIHVDIDFVGIWDSVGSIGLGIPPIPFSSENTTIKCFRHALSLDERRCRFKANVWMHQYEEESHAGGGRRRAMGSKLRELIRGNKRSREEHKGPPTDIEEVWFSGCHSDVGGGAVPHHTPHTLARISLRWMIRECFRARTGIIFTTESIRGLGMDPDSLNPYGLDPDIPPRPEALPAGNLKIKRPTRSKGNDPKKSDLVPGSEEEEELHDAMAASYDQLECRPLWWLLEIIPTIRRDVENGRQTVKVLRANLGRPRVIEAQERLDVKVHRSVRTRRGTPYEPKRASDAKDNKKYEPRASFNEPTCKWVG